MLLARASLGSCADFPSPPALLCHVAVRVWVSMFAIWILDFLRLFVYLFIRCRSATALVAWIVLGEQQAATANTARA